MLKLMFCFIFLPIAFMLLLVYISVVLFIYFLLVPFALLNEIIGRIFNAGKQTRSLD